MDFGDVLRGLKIGRRYAREGWNGKGMFIYYTGGKRIPLEEWHTTLPGQEITWGEIGSGYVIIKPHIDMMTAQGERVIGWLASQTDMLADDWYEVTKEAGE